MTRARDFADVISGNFDLPAGALDNASGETVFQKATVASTGSVSLNLGGNDTFFDAGTLTGNTTVSFASAPTKKKFTYSFIPGYDSSATSVNDLRYWYGDTTTSANPLQMGGCVFNSDGTKAIYSEVYGDHIIEATLLIPYDMGSRDRSSLKFVKTNSDTASFANNGSVGDGTHTFPVCVQSNADGTLISYLSSSQDDLRTLVLSTGFDLSTVTGYIDKNVGGYETNPLGFTFAPDGNTLVISGSVGDDLNEYSVGTAFYVSGASWLRDPLSSSQLGTYGAKGLRWGKGGGSFYFCSGNSQLSLVRRCNITSNSFSLATCSNPRTDHALSFGSLGIDQSHMRSWAELSLDRLMPCVYADGRSFNAIVEMGESYHPTFSGIISGKLGHFSRGYRHFIDFETSNSGTNFGIIDHRKVYVG